MTFPAQIAKALPPDNELRVGTVTATNPLTVAIEGGTIKSPGRLGSYGPMTGDVVAILRQDSTWLVLGESLSNASTVPGAGITTMTQAIATAAIPVVAATTLITGTSITFTTSRANARYQAWYCVDYQQVGATQTTGITELFQDGAAASIPGPIIAPQVIFVGATATPIGLRTAGLAQQFFGLVSAAGTHTLDLRVHRSGGGDGNVTVNSTHTSLMVTVYE